jgi:hypothetical protein
MELRIHNYGYIVQRPIQKPKTLGMRIADKVEAFFLSIAKILGFKPKPVLVPKLSLSPKSEKTTYVYSPVYERTGRRHTTIDALFKSCGFEAI